MQFVRFIFVGVVNTAVDLVVLNFLLFTSGQSHSKVALIVFNTMSASISALVSFVLNKHVVFRKKDTKNHLVIYFILITLSGLFIVQNTILGLIIDPLRSVSPHISDIINNIIELRISADVLALNIAKLIASMATVIWNYFLYRRFIFRKTAK